MISNDISFKEFIWKSKSNKLLIIGSIVISITIWIVFKKYYPNANLIFDSYHYLIATEQNASVYAWPIGYSQFIRLIGNISHSVTFLIATQYFILEICFLTLLLTIRYFFKISSITSIIICLLFHLNPIFIYTSNIIISDILFTAISIAWLTQLLWIIFSPRNWFIFSHSVLLLMAFTIRYNALYYPIISLLAFLLTDKSLKYKMSGISLSFFVISVFILFTSLKMEKNYGVRQFSPFGGWKLANDALYMYEYEYRNNHDTIPLRFRKLDNTVRNYFNKPHEFVHLFKPDVTFGSYYMYIYPSPLMEYMRKTQGDDPNPLNFKVFAPMGPLYQDYGTFLIKKYPLSFFNYFLLPNIFRYFYPTQEVYTDDVNPFILRHDDLDASARKWFGINSTEASEKAINIRHKIFQVYPIFNTIIHSLFLLSSLVSIIFGVIKDKKIVFSFLLVTVLFVVDFGFSIFAAAVVLRYEIFITTIELIFSVLMIESILHIDKESYPTTINIKQKIVQ